MFIAVIVFQGFALLGLVFWWLAWSGRSTAWLEGRKRGWPPMAWFLLFVFFQGLVFGGLGAGTAASGPLVDSDAIFLLAALFWYMLTPLAVVAAFFWMPRFLLPGWLRERLKAGDPARSRWPVDEVAHLMTKRQNIRPVLEPTDQLLRLPVGVRVRTGRWWSGGLLLTVFSVVLWSGVLGVPNSLYEDQSSMMVLLRVGAVVAAPLGTLMTVYYFWAAVVPDHVRLDEHGVASRRFQIAWGELTGVEVRGDPEDRRTPVQIWVTEAAFAREGVNNRWFSGVPMGVGGLVARSPRLRLQPGLKLTAGQVAATIEHHSTEQQSGSARSMPQDTRQENSPGEA